MITPIRCLTVISAALLIGVTSIEATELETSTEDSEATAGGIDKFARNYDGNILLFPDDSAPIVEKGEQLIELEKVFASDRAKEYLEWFWKRSLAQTEFQESFLGKATLEAGTAIPGEKPSFEIYDATRLPEKAVIEWKVTKEELIAFNLPGWEERWLGNPNIYNFLKAWIEYQRYNVARLKLELIDARGIDSTEERAVLQTTVHEAKKSVIEYFQTPPAD